MTDDSLLASNLRLVILGSQNRNKATYIYFNDGNYINSIVDLKNTEYVIDSRSFTESQYSLGRLFSAVVFTITPSWGFWNFFLTGTYTGIGTCVSSLKML